MNTDLDLQPVESAPCNAKALWNDQSASLGQAGEEVAANNTASDLLSFELDETLESIAANRLAHLPGPQGEPPLGVLNGRFGQSNPAASDYGWTRTGSANIQNGQGVINEDAVVFSGLKEEFRIPAGATALRFTITGRTLNASASNPPDAFEVALLDSSLNSLVPVVQGLSGSDAFLNLQASGELFFGSTTQVTGATVSGQSPALSFPTVVTVSLAGIPTNTAATLYLDLLGFGAVDSSVQIDNITILGYDAPPVTLQLAPGFDTGTVGDNLTTLSVVTLQGNTDALATVKIDIDNDGFDDGTTTANTLGAFTFTNVALASGVNTLRAQAGEAPAQSIATLPVTLDVVGPTSTLVSPAPSSNVLFNQGYVEVQWADALSGLNLTTINTSDVTITGVSVDRVEDRGGGLYRYHYADDGQILPAGTITVQRVAGQVADLSGNVNLAASNTFVVPLLVEAGPNFTVNKGNAALLSGAKFSFAGNHSLLTLSINWGDGQTQPVTLPAGSGGGNITASHTYANSGVFTARLTLRDNLNNTSEDTVRISVVAAACPWQNPRTNLGLDVDNDGFITPADSAMVVSELNVNGPRSLPTPPVPPNVPPPFYDTSCDTFLTPLDSALIVNYLNSLGGGEGEAVEGSAAFAASQPEIADPPVSTSAVATESEELPDDDADLANQAVAAWLALNPAAVGREAIFAELAPPERSYLETVLALLSDERTPLAM